MITHRTNAHVTAEEAERARRLSEVHGHQTVVALTGISSSTLCELKQRGFRSLCRPLRAIPTDWSIIAPGQTQAELQRHYAAGPSTVQRWLRLKPVTRPQGGTAALPIPADLADTLARLSQTKTAEHYGVSNAMVIRWRALRSLDIKGRSTLGWEDRYRAALSADAAHQFGARA